MKPILVVVHIYYLHLWLELKKCIQNIGSYPFELYVTMTEKVPDIEKDIRQTFPEAVIEIVENRGYDIAPFLHVLKKINLGDYSYIVKLHTRRDLSKIENFRNMVSSDWRTKLLSPFSTKTIFEEYIKSFEKYSYIGMQAHYQCIIHHDTYDPPARRALKKFLKQHNLPRIKHAFVGGTLFIVRAHLFKTIQDLNVDLSDFPESTTQDGKHPTQLAHVIERFLGYTIYQQGYVISDGIVSMKKQWLYHQKIYLSFLVSPVIRLFYEKRITTSERLLIRIFRIPILNKKIYD